MLVSMIDEMLVNAEEHSQTIQEAQGRPYVFDDALVARRGKAWGSARPPVLQAS